MVSSNGDTPFCPNCGEGCSCIELEVCVCPCSECDCEECECEECNCMLEEEEVESN